jgi:hypothetical protein
MRQIDSVTVEGGGLLNEMCELNSCFRPYSLFRCEALVMRVHCPPTCKTDLKCDLILKKLMNFNNVYVLLNCMFVIWCSLCLLVLYMSCFRQTQRYANQLAHISLCIFEFIGRAMPLHVSAYGAIIRRYINKQYTIELCILYGSIYCTYHCVLQ